MYIPLKSFTSPYSVIQIEDIFDATGKNEKIEHNFKLFHPISIFFSRISPPKNNLIWNCMTFNLKGFVLIFKGSDRQCIVYELRMWYCEHIF